MQKSDINQGLYIGSVVDISDTRSTLYKRRYCYVTVFIERTDNRGVKQAENVRVKLYNGLVDLIKQRLHLGKGDRVEIGATAKSRGLTTEIVAQKIKKLN